MAAFYLIYIKLNNYEQILTNALYYNFLLYIFSIYNVKVKYIIIFDNRSFVYFDFYLFDVKLNNCIYPLNLCIIIIFSICIVY